DLRRAAALTLAPRRPLGRDGVAPALPELRFPEQGLDRGTGLGGRHPRLGERGPRLVEALRRGAVLRQGGEDGLGAAMLSAGLLEALEQPRARLGERRQTRRDLGHLPLGGDEGLAPGLADARRLAPGGACRALGLAGGGEGGLRLFGGEPERR